MVTINPIYIYIGKHMSKPFGNTTWSLKCTIRKTQERKHTETNKNREAPNNNNKQ